MLIKPVHLEFWRACKASPAWAGVLGKETGYGPSKAPALIDRCVNAHWDMPPDRAQSLRRGGVANTCSLIRSMRKREGVRSILARMAHTSSPPADVRRRANAIKWLARINKENPLPARDLPFGRP